MAGAEALQEARERLARLRDGLSKGRPQALGAVEVEGRLLAEASQVGEDEVGDRAGLSLELLGGGLEGEGLA